MFVRAANSLLSRLELQHGGRVRFGWPAHGPSGLVFEISLRARKTGTSFAGLAYYLYSRNSNLVLVLVLV